MLAVSAAGSVTCASSVSVLCVRVPDQTLSYGVWAADMLLLVGWDVELTSIDEEAG
jgi:hypothetical protein